MIWLEGCWVGQEIMGWESNGKKGKKQQVVSAKGMGQDSAIHWAMESWKEITCIHQPSLSKGKSSNTKGYLDQRVGWNIKEGK